MKIQRQCETFAYRVAAWTPSSTPLIARGACISPPEDDHELFHAINEHRATPEQLLKLVTHDGDGVGEWWGTYGGEHGELDPEGSCYGHLVDFQGHAGDGERPDLSVSEYIDSGQYRPGESIYVEVPVVMIADRPKRGDELWEPEIHNPSNGLMGNSYLDRGEQLPLREIHYHSGRDWVRVPMPDNTMVRTSAKKKYADGFAYRLATDAGYSTVHEKVRDEKGAPSGHSCVDCGSKADHWTYDHSSDSEKTKTNDSLPYSTDTRNYSPRCRSCHNKLDAK